MKKFIAILLATSLILTGCEDKKQQVKDTENKENVVDVEQEEIKEETNKEIEKEEVKDDSKTEIKEESKKEETKKEEVKKEPVSSNNDAKTETKEEIKKEEVKEETVTPQQPSCTAKKFDKKYSYAYKTKDECVSKGNNAFMEVYENVDNTVFTYGCAEIVDDCGDTWYGVYFNRFTEDGSVVKVYH